MLLVRLPLLAALALLAVGASAAPYWIKTFYLLTDEGPEIRVESVKTGFVNLQVNGLDTWRYGLTSEEAASLGRALLEAAGQPEKVCAAQNSIIIGPGDLRMPPSMATTECTPEKCPGANLYGRTLQLKTDPWVIGDKQCRPIPCPDGRVGCAVNHMVCDGDSK